MPTYRNRRNAVLCIDSEHNYRTGMVESRHIRPGELFIAQTSSIPDAWFAPSPHEPPGTGPWVELVHDVPTDEELRST